MTREDLQKFYMIKEEKKLKIKKLSGHKMRNQIIGEIKQNLMGMLVEFMVFNGEILMALIKYKI